MVPLSEEETGCNRVRTTEFEQVMEPRALSRFWVIVFDKLELLSPPAKMRFLIAFQSRLESCAFKSAATPVT